MGGWVQIHQVSLFRTPQLPLASSVPPTQTSLRVAESSLTRTFCSKPMRKGQLFRVVMLSRQKLRYMSEEKGLLSCKFIGRTKRNPPKHVVKTKRILIRKQEIIGNWTFLRVWQAHVCMVAMAGHRAAEL